MKQRFLIITTLCILFGAISIVFFAAQRQMNHAQTGYSSAYFNTIQSTVDLSTASFDALTLTLNNFESASAPVEYQIVYQFPDDTRITSQQIVPSHTMVIVPAPEAVRTWFTEHTSQPSSLLQVTILWEDQTLTLKKLVNIVLP